MSATTHRIPLADAQALAGQVADMLRPACVRLEIAGSIRRQKQDIGDIELVAQVEDDALDHLLNAHVASGTFGEPRRKTNGSRLAWGPRYKATSVEGIALDVFIVRPGDSWGVTYLLRTGSGDANQALVTQRSKGGIMPDDVVMREGHLWRSGQRLITPDEADVYAAVGLPFVPPPQRSPETYRQLAAPQTGEYTHFGPGGQPRAVFLALLAQSDADRRAYYRHRAEGYLARLPAELARVEAEGKAARQRLDTLTAHDDPREAQHALAHARSRYATLLEMRDEALRIVEAT